MLRLPPCERGTCFVRVLAGSPAYKCFRQRRKPWRKAGFIPAAQVKLIGVPGQSAGLAGGNPKGGGCPPLCRCGGRFPGGGHNRKCPPPGCAFAYFSHEGKVGRGPGAKPPKFPGCGGGAPAKEKLLLLPHEEQRQGPGTGVVAEDGAPVV